MEKNLINRNPEADFDRKKQEELCLNMITSVEQHYQHDLDACNSYMDEMKILGLLDSPISFDIPKQLYPPSPFLIRETREAQHIMETLDVNPYSQLASEKKINELGEIEHQNRVDKYYAELAAITRSGKLQVGYGYTRFEEGEKPKPYVIVSPDSGITQYFGTSSKPSTLGIYIQKKINEIKEVINKTQKVSNGMKETPFISKSEFTKKYKEELHNVVPGWLIDSVLQQK